MSDKQLNLHKLEKCFIIAEIGQNHQGNLRLAKDMIKIAKECGADCVKFQKTDINEKFTKAALDRPYQSENSFGATYGEHKQFLEFSETQFMELQDFANQTGILFSASAMDLKSLEFLVKLNLPFIKIGSGDANNFPLIEKAASTQIPLIISTGMQNFDTVKKIYETVSKKHKEFALLHCISAYPTPYKDVNLSVLTLFRSEFPDIPIGYSGHELGNHISTAAVALGSKVIEKHLTTDKNLKGTDHNCSLEPTEFSTLVSNIRSLETALGSPQKIIQNSELPCYNKLGKTLIFSKNLPAGHLVTSEDFKIKISIPKGIDGSQLENIIGKTLVEDVKENDSVLKKHVI